MTFSGQKLALKEGLSPYPATAVRDTSIGVGRIFDWKGGGAKQHAITSEVFRKEVLVMGSRYRRMEDKKPGVGLVRSGNQDFAKKEGLESKSFSKMSKLADTLSKVNINILNKKNKKTQTYSVGAEFHAAGGYGGLGAKPSAAG